MFRFTTIDETIDQVRAEAAGRVRDFTDAEKAYYYAALIGILAEDMERHCQLKWPGPANEPGESHG